MGVVKVSGWSKENLEGAYGRVDECWKWMEWCSTDASKVVGTVRRIEVEEVLCAMDCMKIGKASGPSEVGIELFKAGRDKYLKSLTIIFDDILFRDKLLEEWMLTLLVPIFKENGDLLNPDSYMGVK